MHHGPEMSSVSLLIQPFSITPTLTPSRDDEEGDEEEEEKRGEGRHGGSRWKKESVSQTMTVRNHT